MDIICRIPGNFLTFGFFFQNEGKKMFSTNIMTLSFIYKKATKNWLDQYRHTV